MAPSRRFFVVLITVLTIVVAPVTLVGPLNAAEQGDTALVMITADHCPWCEAFEDEVGSIYDRTPESQAFPLVRVDYLGPMPEGMGHITHTSFTPTFIFVRDNVEVGRIVGYPGSELFWWRMAEFLPENG